MLAAAGLFALDNNFARIQDDHRRARELADRLNKLGFTCAPPQTNMVFVSDVPRGVDLLSLQVSLASEGLLIMPDNAKSCRFVFHRDIPSDGVDRLVAALQKACS